MLTLFTCLLCLSKVILGMGAFAIENMRTAFERGAAHVTLLCRQRGSVCPQLIDWVNFIRPWGLRNNLPRHDAAGDAQVLQAWRTAYDASGAVKPECWQQDLCKAKPIDPSRMLFKGTPYPNFLQCELICMIPLCRCGVKHAWPYSISMYFLPFYEQGMLKPDGHTVSVSDLFFIAHSLGMLVRRVAHMCLFASLNRMHIWLVRASASP